MKTGKEIILNYCENVKTDSVEHLEVCNDIKEDLKNNTRKHLIYHCPSAFGLNNFTGLCEIYDENTDEQCSKCWDEALKVIVCEHKLENTDGIKIDSIGKYFIYICIKCGEEKLISLSEIMVKVNYLIDLGFTPEEYEEMWNRKENN